jgi:hypothetical protein
MPSQQTSRSLELSGDSASSNALYDIAQLQVFRFKADIAVLLPESQTPLLTFI